jgi:hypothetical protein
LTETDRLTEGERLGQGMTSGSVRLESVINRIIEKSNGTGRLLIVSDQFEELWCAKIPSSGFQPNVTMYIGRELATVSIRQGHDQNGTNIRASTR